jgi:two-component system response regulator PilR (NtrC family)
VPSLRERRETYPLAEALLRRIASMRTSGEAADAVSGRTGGHAESIAFPGNVRELENMLERAFARCATGRPARPMTCSSAALRGRIQGTRRAESGEILLTGGRRSRRLPGRHRAAGAERGAGGHRWNRTETARALGISFRSLRYRMKKLELDDD